MTHADTKERFDIPALENSNFEASNHAVPPFAAGDPTTGVQHVEMPALGAREAAGVTPLVLRLFSC
jgi:hypothetical protein